VALGAKRIKHIGSKYKYKYGDVIINWGCSEINNPEVLQAMILNSPYQVSIASNKKTFFDRYPASRAHLIQYTTDRDKAHLWQLLDETVVARHVLNGHSGEGIEIVEPTDLLPYAPLYTKYKKKTDEYRIHFSGDRLIKFARKGRKMDVPVEEVNWKVRNIKGGFVYAIADHMDMPRPVLDAAEDFASKTLLNFGAIDIIYHRPTDCAYILEVNTAPGLSGSTIEAYAEALRVG
jgi:hypothetical protein